MQVITHLVHCTMQKKVVYCKQIIAAVVFLWEINCSDFHLLRFL